MTVRSIAALCRSLRPRVTADGLWTAEQFTMLADSGCDMVQGHLIGQPAAATGAEAASITTG